MAWHLCAASMLSGLLPLPAIAQEMRTRRTKEATVRSNTSTRIAKAVAKRIDNYCRIFADFFDGLGLDKKSDNKLVARVFNTYDEYEAFYRRTHPDRHAPMAYFSPSLNAIVLYNDEADMTLRQTLFHECSHQYFNRYTYDEPRWLGEGVAEYFEGWRTRPDGTLVEKRINLYDLVILQQALRAGKYVSPKKLVEMPDGDFRDFSDKNPELHGYLHYASSWGIVWYSLEGNNRADRERLVTYFRDLNSKGARARLVVDDWKAFERRWRGAILALEPVCADALDHVLLAGGYRSNWELGKAIEEYRAALAKDPKLPGVQYSLGLCYKRAGLYGRATKWLEKARELDPRNPSAAYLLGRIALGLDREEAPSDPVKALALATEASKLAGGKSPRYLELLARAHAATGNRRSATRAVRRILMLVDDEKERSYYKKLLDELKALAKASKKKR